MLPSENTLIGPRTPFPLPSGRDAAAAHTRAGCPQQSAGRGGTDAASGPQARGQVGFAPLFSFLYSTSPRTSIAFGGTVMASNIDEARKAASNAVKAKYPDGVLKVIERVSGGAGGEAPARFPVKNQDGWIAPSLLEGDIH